MIENKNKKCRQISATAYYRKQNSLDYSLVGEKQQLGGGMI